jgi:hypothetical protein
MWRQLILALVVLVLAAVRPRRPGGGGGGDDAGGGRPRDRDGGGGRPRTRVAPVADLEGGFTQVETRLTAGTPPQGGTGTPTIPRGTGPGTQLQNAGQWSPPTTPRHHGHPFNAEYEAWIRRQTGGPEDGTEYLVRHDGEQAFFDANDVRDHDGASSEVLIDGKGRYEQFIDPDTGDFKPWWRDSEKSGLPAELAQAERQVRVADGRQVEWWCAEQATADAFNDAFANNPNLNGRIVAVYRPPA